MSIKMRRVFAKELQNLELAGLLRIEIPVTQVEPMVTQISDKKQVINFTSNDFLGWNNSTKLKKAATDAVKTYGCGHTTSRTAVGTLDIYRELEKKLSHTFGTEDTLVLPSHYMATASIFDAMTTKRDMIFIDEMSNPGYVDGSRFCRAQVFAYKNRDYKDLEYYLKCSQNARFRIIASDAVFNGDGNIADISRIFELRDIYDAITVFDDSLGVGILGEKGRGTFEYLQTEHKPDLLTGSFAYALGNISGGYISGEKTLIDWLRQTSRIYNLAEPISPVNAAVALKALELLQEDPASIKKVYNHAKFLKKEILFQNWKLIKNDHPLVSIVIGNTLKVQKIVEDLFKRDILVSGLCYPHTSEDGALIRINLSANHTKAHVETLLDCLKKSMKKYT